MESNKMVFIVLLVPGFSTLTPLHGQQTSVPSGRQIPRYKLVDLGTLGGRASYVNPPWSLGAHYQMNRHGVTVGSAATSVPTSLGCPFCNGLDGQVFNVFHAFKWSGGVLKDLGALPRGTDEQRCYFDELKRKRCRAFGK